MLPVLWVSLRGVTISNRVDIAIAICASAQLQPLSSPDSSTSGIFCPQPFLSLLSAPLTAAQFNANATFGLAGSEDSLVLDTPLPPLIEPAFSGPPWFTPPVHVLVPPPVWLPSSWAAHQLALPFAHESPSHDRFLDCFIHRIAARPSIALIPLDMPTAWGELSFITSYTYAAR